MQISKLYKKRIIAFVVLGIMLVTTGAVMGELLRPFNFSTDIYNKEYNEMKSNKQKIDMVIIGNSRTLLSLDPVIFKEKLGLNKVFNISMGAQSIVADYYILKEVIEEFHPSYVVMGLDETILTHKYIRMISHLRNLERLHGTNYRAYIKDNFIQADYAYLIPCFAYRGNLGQIRDNTRMKLQFQEEGVNMKTDKWQSMGNGFVVYSNRNLTEGNIGIPRIKTFEKSKIKEETINYLNKCVQLCQTNNIKLFFVTAPTSMAELYSINNYEDYTKFASEYAMKHKIKYHNLSYIKGKETLLPDNFMFDIQHVNKAGAEVTSKIYAEILKKELHGTDTKKFFHRSLGEVKSTVKRIVGVDAKPVKNDNTLTMTIRSLQNKGIIPQYEILLAGEDNNFKPVVGWTKQKKVSFEIPKETTCRILLRARRQNDVKATAWMAWEIDEQGEIRKINDVPVEKIF